MKPIKFSKKLRFTKETVADLTSKEKSAVHGGWEEEPKPSYLLHECTITACQTECPSGGVPCNYC